MSVSKGLILAILRARDLVKRQSRKIDRLKRSQEIFVTFYLPSECQRYVSRLSCSPFLEISLNTSISLPHSFSLDLEKYFNRHISSLSFFTQEVKYP